MFTNLHLSIKTTLTILSVFLVFNSFSQRNENVQVSTSSELNLKNTDPLFEKKQKELVSMFRNFFDTFKKENDLNDLLVMDKFIKNNNYSKLVPDTKTFVQLSKSELGLLVQKNYDGMLKFHDHLKKEFITIQ